MPKATAQILVHCVLLLVCCISFLFLRPGSIDVLSCSPATGLFVVCKLAISCFITEAEPNGLGRYAAVEL